MTIIYPALKIKAGEIEAFRQSERVVVDAATPVFDVARPSSKTPIQKRLNDSLDLLRKAWPRISREFYLDLRDLPLESRLENGAHPVYYLANHLAYHGYKAIHCFGFDRDDAYEDAITKVLAENSNAKVALRLEQQDMKLLDTTEDLARGFLGRVSKNFETTTVFLDLQSIHESTDDLSALVERSYLRFKKLGVNHIVLLASAMWDFTRIKTEKINMVPRLDIGLWDQLRRKGLELGYGDYGVVAPSFIDPEKTVIPAPKLRYTTNSHWLVAKGEKPRKGENSQYPRLAQRLMKTAEFRADDLGWGHDRLREFASYEQTTVGHARAVAIDTCTHLDIVTRQVMFTEHELATAKLETENSVGQAVPRK